MFEWAYLPGGDCADDEVQQEFNPAGEGTEPMGFIITHTDEVLVSHSGLALAWPFFSSCRSMSGYIMEAHGYCALLILGAALCIRNGFFSERML